MVPQVSLWKIQCKPWGAQLHKLRCSSLELVGRPISLLAMPRREIHRQGRDCVVQQMCIWQDVVQRLDLMPLLSSRQVRVGRVFDMPWLSAWPLPKLFTEVVLSLVSVGQILQLGSILLQ